MCDFKTILKIIFLLIGVPTIAGVLLYVAGQWAMEEGFFGWGIYFLIVLVGYEVLMILKLKNEIKECVE